MMDARIIKAYLSKVPAVLCTAGSYIAAKNAEARKSLPQFSEGGRLFERMSPESILKYEAHFAATRTSDDFCFTVNSPDGPWLALAAFDSICDRRFAAVFFFKSREDMNAALSFEMAEPSDREKAAFAQVLLGIGDDCFEPMDKRGLIDLKKYTAHLISRLDFLGLSVSFCENGEAERAICMPEDIHSSSYMQMIMMMVLALGNASRGGSVSVKLCKYGNSAEICCAANVPFELLKIRDQRELAREIPAATPYLSLCEYIAGLCGCTLEVRSGKDSLLSLVLVIGERQILDVDFKSRDHLLYFEEEMAFSRQYVLRLLSDDTE